MKHIALIASLGALGTLLRYGLDRALENWNHNFPLSTFLVNIIGCFFAGLIFLRILNSQMDSNLGNILLVAFCGSFTTLSAYSVQSLKMFESGQLGLGLIYAITTPVLGLLAAFVPRFF